MIRIIASPSGNPSQCLLLNNNDSPKKKTNLKCPKMRPETRPSGLLWLSDSTLCAPQHRDSNHSGPFASNRCLSTRLFESWVLHCLALPISSSLLALVATVQVHLQTMQKLAAEPPNSNHCGPLSKERCDSNHGFRFRKPQKSKKKKKTGKNKETQTPWPLFFAGLGSSVYWVRDSNRCAPEHSDSNHCGPLRSPKTL